MSVGQLIGWLADPQLQGLLRAAVIIIVGASLARLLERRLPVRRLHPQYQMMARRVAKYLVLGAALAWALQQLGVSLSVILGAAGILTVALGFAAQTSASNLISGVFLLAEQPFRIGDTIRAGDATGVVHSVDLLSVRLRTFDGLLVRIPNETMLKSNVTNFTHFPIRRVDVLVGVAYDTDLSAGMATLVEVADQNPTCLEEPPPQVFMKGYSDSAIDLQLSGWCARENYIELRNALYAQVVTALRTQGIEIPFPHRAVLFPGDRVPAPVRPD